MIVWSLREYDMVLDWETSDRYQKDGTIRDGIRREAKLIADCLGHRIRVLDFGGYVKLDEVAP